MKLLNSAVCGALLAISPGIVLLSSTTGASAALEVVRNGPVPFVSGGVGEDERQEIGKRAPAYSLELLFAAKGSPNEYLADIKVEIKDKNGEVVLDAVSQGPFLLAKVSPGKYSISADNDGAVKRQTIQVAGTKPRRVVFIW